MSRRVSRVVHKEADIPAFLAFVERLLRQTLPGGPVEATFGRLVRSLSQNRKLWPMLSDVASQHQLVVNGIPLWADEEDWKDVFTAALDHDLRVAEGIDGRIVLLGLHTSQMEKAEFSALVELIYAYGAAHGTRWSEPSRVAFDKYRAVA